MNDDEFNELLHRFFIEKGYLIPVTIQEVEWAEAVFVPDPDLDIEKSLQRAMERWRENPDHTWQIRLKK